MTSLVRFVRIALPASLLLAAAVMVPLKVFDHRGLARVDRLRQELLTLEEENRAIQRENDAFRQQIHAFHSDPGYIEKVARDELGMVGPDEIIYQFPDDRP